MTIKEFIRELDNADCDITECSEFTSLCCRRGVDCNYGASRLCAIFPKEKKVLKIVRNDVNTDYCELEMEYYRKAKELGIAEMLLPVELYAILNNGVKVYVQPMYSYAVESLPQMLYNQLQKKYGKAVRSKTYNKICGGFYTSPSSVWLGAAITIYGKKVIRLLEQWTRDNKINDLHTGNCGFLNGKPILLDYAGFFD